MIHNSYDVQEGRADDHPPVIMLSSLDGLMTWLLSEIDPFYEGIAFGLCDLGIGCPELGYVPISDLEKSPYPKTGIPFVGQDKEFVASYPMSVYAEAARMCQKITVNRDHLAIADKLLKRTID